MYLKRIEIQGFKSFADPIAIDFKEGITCIIGPNGSGKSNISDAMRWVLGEQSARALRGARMEEIIFAGTDTRRAKGMAEVTLVLDNSTGILDIDYSEVALRRRLYRSGESEYFINGNPCRLRDIRELIMDTGIGVDGYSFIGQGRVEKIVSDKPENRREVFEEAAGIIKYKSKRAEAERKLEGAGANLARIGDIVADIEGRIDGLREESEKAKEYQGLAARYRELEINITLKNIESMQAKNRELAEQFEEAGRALETLRGEKAETDVRLSALRARDTELEERITGLRESLNTNRAKAMGIENSTALYEERRRNMEKDRDRLREEAALYARRIAEEEEEAAEFAVEKRRIAEMLEAQGKELADLLGAAAEKEGAFAAQAARIDELRAQLFEVSRERALKEAELASGEGLFGSFDETEAGISAEIEAGTGERGSLENVIEDLAAAAGRLAEETSLLAGDMEASRARYDEVSSGIADKRIDLEALRLKIEKQASRQRTLEELEANYEGYGAGVRALMKEGLHGVHGVVAELLTADKGFETAIETALGQAAQNIVVETDGDAKKAIAFLKENKAGRLTFLPVQSINPRGHGPARDLEGSGGFAGYALDHVRFEERFEDIFEYLLGRTAIAETLDDAAAMSKRNAQGYRIVTVEGEIVTPAGTLTGGAYKNKTANLFERRTEIEALKQEIERWNADAERGRDELDRLAEESSALLVRIRDGDAALREKEAERIRAEADADAARARLSDLEARLTKRQGELTGIAKDRESNSGLLEQLREQIAALTEAISAIEEASERESAALPERKAESGRAAAAATELRLRVAEAGRDKENADTLLEATLRGIGQYKEQQAAKEAECAELERALTVTAEEVSAAELVSLEAERVGLEAAIEQAASERREARGGIERAELASDSGAGRIESRITSKNGMEVELGRQETRLQTWKEKLFEEFELSYVHALEYRDPSFVMGTGMKENREIKDRLREIGEVNLGSIKEYEETSERYAFLTGQRDDVLASMKDFEDIVRDMDKISREKFCETFDLVSETFAETFSLLFGGGKGEITLEDESDPLESGIEIKIRPPGKTNLASIDSYSGGEKSMIAIALLFSILKAKPTPFCILDEIDAALDETNIHRFANYVANFRETQFALVTHQRSTMEYAETLFGVTMQEQGVTTVLSLLLGTKETDAFAETLNDEN
ncbi:MAG: chromosome segregation protein SMC [Clostridiales bacterium]|nr:chromosome segregation protein SMC [Clostridiales bacterium]